MADPHNGDELDRAMDSHLVRIFLDLPLTNGAENRMRIAANELLYRVRKHLDPSVEPPHASDPYPKVRR